MSHRNYRRKFKHRGDPSYFDRDYFLAGRAAKWKAKTWEQEELPYRRRSKKKTWTIEGCHFRNYETQKAAEQARPVVMLRDARWALALAWMGDSSMCSERVRAAARRLEWSKGSLPYRYPIKKR